MILVTGASGFVGRHLVTYLISSGHEVVSLVRDNVKTKKEFISFNKSNLINNKFYNLVLAARRKRQHLKPKVNCRGNFEFIIASNL